jgi:methyl-accepting chemotaxis protein
MEVAYPATEVTDSATEVAYPATEVTDSARRVTNPATEVTRPAKEVANQAAEVNNLARGATAPTHAVLTQHAWTMCTCVASRTRPQECCGQHH